MFGKRKDVRPSDDAFLALLHKKVLAEEPVLLKRASIRNGILVGRQGWSVMVLPPSHSDNPNRYDLGFVPNLEAEDHRVIVDCVKGFGTPRAEALPSKAFRQPTPCSRRSKGAGRSRAPEGGDRAPDEGGTGPIGHVGCRTG